MGRLRLVEDAVAARGEEVARVATRPGLPVGVVVEEQERRVETALADPKVGDPGIVTGHVDPEAAVVEAEGVVVAVVVAQDDGRPDRRGSHAEQKEQPGGRRDEGPPAVSYADRGR